MLTQPGLGQGPAPACLAAGANSLPKCCGTWRQTATPVTMLPAPTALQGLAPFLPRRHLTPLKFFTAALFSVGSLACLLRQNNGHPYGSIPWSTSGRPIPWVPRAPRWQNLGGPARDHSLASLSPALVEQVASTRAHAKDHGAARLVRGHGACTDAAAKRFCICSLASRSRACRVEAAVDSRAAQRPSPPAHRLEVQACAAFRVWRQHCNT